MRRTDSDAPALVKLNSSEAGVLHLEIWPVHLKVPTSAESGLASTEVQQNGNLNIHATEIIQLLINQIIVYDASQ